MCLYVISPITIFTSQQSKLNPLNLTVCDLVFGPVVKLVVRGDTCRRSSDAFDPRHALGTGRLPVRHGCAPESARAPFGLDWPLGEKGSVRRASSCRRLR